MFKSEKEVRDQSNQNMDYEMYHFLSEEIQVKDKLRHQKIFKEVAATIVMGVLFGLVSMISYVAFGDLYEANTSEDNPIKIQTATPSAASGAGSPQSQSYTNTIEKIKPCLIAVSSTRSEADWFQNIHERGTAEGSGVIMHWNGREAQIVINQQLVEQGNKLHVTFRNNMVSPEEVLVETATVVGTNHDVGLAVIKVSVPNMSESMKASIKAAVCNLDKMMEGEQIIQLSNSNQNGYVARIGFVSSVEQKHAVTDGQVNIIRTDVLEDEEQNGGAACNEKGEVVGIILSGYYVGDAQYSSVLPISEVKTYIENMLNDKKGVLLGIKGIEIDKNKSDTLNIPQGICVESIVDKSPAASEGLRIEDILVKVDDEEVLTLEKLEQVLSVYKKNDKIILHVNRKNGKQFEEIEIEVQLQ